MPIFIVGVREVHVSYRRVDAATSQEALDQAGDCFDDEVSLEYSHTLDKENWSVEGPVKDGDLRMAAMVRVPRWVEDALFSDENDVGASLHTYYASYSNGMRAELRIECAKGNESVEITWYGPNGKEEGSEFMRLYDFEEDAERGKTVERCYKFDSYDLNVQVIDSKESPDAEREA